MAPPGNTSHPDRTTELFATLLSTGEDEKVEYLGDPMESMMLPIFDKRKVQTDT
jgi:hypothetical protein